MGMSIVPGAKVMPRRNSDDVRALHGLSIVGYRQLKNYLLSLKNIFHYNKVCWRFILDECQLYGKMFRHY